MYNKLKEELDQCREEKVEMEFQNQKFECRLKQAQIILNDNADGLNILPSDHSEMNFAGSSLR